MTFILVVGLIIFYFVLSRRVSHLEKLLQHKPDVAPVPLPVPTPQVPEPSPVVMPEPMATPAPVMVHEDQNLEFKVGSKVFTTVGVIAVILGVGFFLRYAFDQNLITESMRVALGVLGGVVLMGLGFFLRAKYASYAHALSGAGLALWYLSVFAAFDFYGLIGFEAAFFAMVAITAAGVGLALLYDSLPLVAFAQIGGFLSPLLISTSIDHPHTLFIYLAILNLGIFAVTLKKPWSKLILGNLLGTIIVFMTWFFLSYRPPAEFDVLFLYATVFFAIFLGTMIASHLLHRLADRAIDSLFAIGLPLIYFGFVFSQLQTLHPEYKTLFVLSLAALYILLGFVLKRDTMWGIAFFFLVVAVPIALDRHWVTIGWAFEGFVAILLARFAASRYLPVAGIIVSLLAFMRFIVMDLRLPLDAHAWTNDRFFTMLFIVVAYALCVAVLWTKRDDPVHRTVASIMLLGVYLVPLIALSSEISDFFAHRWFGVFWSLAALAAVLFSLRNSEPILRIAGYITLLMAAIRIVAFDVSMHVATPVFNARVGLAVLFALCAGILLWSLKYWGDRVSLEEKHVVAPALFIGLNAMLLWTVSHEVADYFDRRNLQRAMMSVAWTVYAILLLLWGIIAKSALARMLSIVLFGVVVFKVFLYDTVSLGDFYRFISFISLGIFLLLAGFLYYRFKDRIQHFIQAES